MDNRATTPELQLQQTSLRFYYDSVLKCNTHCVKNYTSKNMSDEERECVSTCYSKQMALNKSVNTQIGYKK